MNPSCVRIMITIISFTCTLTTLQTSACIRRDDPEYADYRREQERNRSAEGKTQLITALSNNDHKTVKKYKEFLNIKISDAQGTPLCFVIDCGNEAMAPYLLELGADIKDALRYATPKVLKYLLDHNIQNLRPSYLAAAFLHWPKPVIPLQPHSAEDQRMADMYLGNPLAAWRDLKPQIPQNYQILFTHNWVRYCEKKNSIERLKTVLLVHKRDPAVASLPKEILYYMLSFLPDMMWAKKIPLEVGKNNIIHREVTRRLEQVKQFLVTISYVRDPNDKRYLDSSYTRFLLNPDHVLEDWKAPITLQVQKDLVAPWAAVQESGIKKRKL